VKPLVPKKQRCAIYTRKSTEHNLDLAFNSLDAQREACEAYIKSQAHEGWTPVRDHFDDGGLSGASLERPALQRLLDRVRARQVDVIVVYKVDRLTRSLADFAKLVEEFDEHDVSFVSVTQSFNTTSSMGRLTLNVLLSFAQFEREVIGERVRDKIAASKRKGIWVGGPVPLGYRSVAKKLEIVPENAEIVRKIFDNYLRLGSVAELAASLDREGVRPKTRNATTPEARPPRFGVGALFYLLKNRMYVGEIVYRGEIHKGEHQPILDHETFDAVQQRLKDQAIERKQALRASPSLLAGKIFDDKGNAMTPTHANKRGVRYRYYVSQALLQGRKAKAGTISRVSAGDVEGLVIKALRHVDEAHGGVGRSDRDLVEAHIVSIVVRRSEIAIEVRTSPAGGSKTADPNQPADTTTITMAFARATQPRKGIIHSASGDHSMDAAARSALLNTVARARSWVDSIAADPNVSFAMIADREQLGQNYVRRLASLAYLSPRIVEAIAEGRGLADLTATKLLNDLPLSWPEQEARFLTS